MRAAFALVVLLASFPLAAALNEPLRLEFSAPAQAQGAATLTRLQWALLVFNRSAAADFSLDLPHGAEATNRSFFWSTIKQDGIAPGYSHDAPIDEKREALGGPIRARASFNEQWASVFVQAESIELDVDAGRYEIQRSENLTPMGYYLPHVNEPDQTYRASYGTTPDGVAVGMVAADSPGLLSFSLRATGLRSVEWHEARVECHSSTCPDGARTSSATVPIPGGQVANDFLSYLELQGDGTLMGAGTVRTMTAGAPSADLSLDGWARFPVAALTGSCGNSACPTPTPGQTFQAEGHVELEELAPIGPTNRLGAGFGGALQAARFDETPANALLSTGAAFGAAAGALGILALGKLLWGLFARNPTRSVLDHPKAKLLHDAILQSPGLSFEGLRRATGLGNGTAQYHLKRLLDRGHVAAYSYGKRVRYFENHGRHTQDWKVHAALHKPELGQLHRWLTGHPRVSQAYILRQTAEWGWSRSTTQNFLKQLESANLVACERMALQVAYLALSPKSEPLGL